ncbi:MAG: metallophosphoesterase [Treponema sp.]|jgi:calcineurin-like phosphoesterase family protein|nr:metallophosphoesterase [Treponema sp.]
MIFFTADTHFNDSYCIELFKRPFSGVEQMDETIIRNWNSCVNDNDEVYILGDFAFTGNSLEPEILLKKLNGRKYLIRGNHDHFLDDKNFNIKNFEWVKDYYVLEYETKKFVLFHYPIFMWDGYFDGTAIHLYGHVHNMLGNKKEQERLNILGKKAMNVGVDMNNFFPVSIEKIIQETE